MLRIRFYLTRFQLNWGVLGGAHARSYRGINLRMNAAFLFLDECFSEKLKLAALTGVLVPVDEYAAVRDEMCRLAWEALRPPANTIP